MAINSRLDRFEQNYIINGNFDFWQRGTSANVGSAAGYFTADRFQFRSGGSGANIDVSRNTDVPSNEFSFSCDIEEAGDAVDNFAHIGQRIEAENIKHLVGKTVTFSCWVKSVNVITELNLILSTPVSGTKDGWTSDLTQDSDFSTNLQTLTVGPWTKISHTFTVPLDAINGLQIRLSNLGDDGVFRFRTAGWQLVEGSNEVPFRRSGKTIQEELQLCKRYYQKSYNRDTVPGTNDPDGMAGLARAATTIFANCDVRFEPEMRIAPAIVIRSQQGAVGNLTNDTNSTNVGVGFSATAGTNTTGFSLLNGSSGLVAGEFYRFHWTADAEL